MFTEHPQSLKALIMSLSEPFQAFITGPNRLKSITFRIIGGNLIERITHELCSELTLQHIRINGQLSHEVLVLSAG